MKIPESIEKNKKLIARVLLTLILVSGILWIVYKPQDPIENLVPGHAAWYIEIDHPLEVLKSSQKGVRYFGEPARTVFYEWQQQLEFVRQLLEKEPALKKFLDNSSLGISSHILPGKESGYIFYMALPASKQENLFDLLRKFYRGKKEFFYQEREYMGTRICEITFRESNVTFSVSASGDALMGSFSGFLVEEVVRKSGLIFKPNFVAKLRKDSRFAGIASRPVRLFVNLPKVSDYLYQYLSPALKPLLLAKTQGSGLVLGMDMPRDIDWASEGYLLQDNPEEMHQHENKLDLEMLSMLPDNHAILYQYQLGNLWQAFPGRKWSNPDPGRDSLPMALDNQALLCLTEGEGLRKYNKLLVAPTRNREVLKAWLDFHGRKSQGDEPYREKAGASEICQITNPRFGSVMGGNILEDWGPLFFAEKGKYLLVADDLDVIKNAIASNSQLPASLQNPGYFRFHIRMGRCIPLLMESAQGIFKSNFQQWIPILKGISVLSLEDHGESENPSFTFRLKWKIPGGMVQNFSTLSTFILDYYLRQGPFRLEAESGKNTHWTLLDSGLNAILLGPKLEPRFQMKMGSDWTSSPQILENKKDDLFSLAMSTKAALHLLSGKGEEEKGFPISLPDSSVSIENMRVVDYDQSQQYRFFIGSRYGDVYTCDLKGKFLPGWSPRKMENPLTQAPRHFRIGDKDLMVMADNMANLSITNRKGELMPGFPVKLNSRSTQPMFFENGLSLKNSYVYVLSDIGEMEKVNMLGEIISRIQLYRPDKNTRFQFLIDQREKTFCLARITGNQVTVFDQSYRPVFDFAAENPDILVQHFHFGASNKIFAVTDFKARKTHLLDETGRPIRQEPLDSDTRVDIVAGPDSETGFRLLKVFGKEVSLLAFEKE